MRKIKQSVRKALLLGSCLFLISCVFCAQQQEKKILSGAENYNEYLPLLQDKNVAIVANQSSMINKMHLVDFLVKKNIQIAKIFSPEHGFRGDAEAGEKIKNNKDVKTGLPVVSLYGKHYKPSVKNLKGIDIMVFDIQDVGVRFYTYISTLHYVMEACAEQNIKLIVLDRPNPNGHYIDGPVLEEKYSSFVGMHKVPVVYGMTIGEYAQMINGESWLNNNSKCELKVIPCKSWNRNRMYNLPVKPSPNLPNQLSVSLYPSLCFFEGTVVSAGRGTDFPFQVYGHPLFSDGDFEFQPRSIEGTSKNPKFKGEKCVAYDLRQTNLNEVRNMGKINLNYLINAYKELKGKVFFNSYFEKLAGTKTLREQIEKGMPAEEIKRTWASDIRKFKEIRKKYLLYPDFE